MNNDSDVTPKFNSKQSNEFKRNRLLYYITYIEKYSVRAKAHEKMAQSYRTIAGRDSTHEAFDELAQGIITLLWSIFLKFSSNGLSFTKITENRSLLVFI